MSYIIRVLIADDHAIVRKGLRLLISNEADMEAAGEAANGDEAITQARKLLPDVILMDLLMPKKSGLEAIQEIKKENPGARILVLTSYSGDHQIFPAIRAGASGYLLKDSLSEDLLQGIRDIYHGRPSLHPSIVKKMMKEFSQGSSQTNLLEPLTSREEEVLKMVAEGMANEEIAQKLCVSVRTVNTHISNILEKLHVKNRTQAALYALREGLASLYQI